MPTFDHGMPRDYSPREVEETRTLLHRVSDLLCGAIAPPRLLREMAWPREVEIAFFSSGAERLPEVSYTPDRKLAQERIALLTELQGQLAGPEPVVAWLTRLLGTFVDANRLVLALGTKEFHRLSREIYGSARSAPADGKLTNLDLAEHLDERLRPREGRAEPEPEPTLTAQELADALERRLARRKPRLPVEIVVDPNIAAKALAGRQRLRLNASARFARWEVEQLWFHEIETHVLTAQNGAGQPNASFLKGGGPRSTMTQEGLAIFSELYQRKLATPRLRRLLARVKLVDLAEQGADFLELYRFLVERGARPHDAFLDAQRVCRGGLVTGGAPFTKDACYLAGLMSVYAFLAVAVRGGLREEAEVLVSGRIALEDTEALILLRRMGLLTPPPYLPEWLDAWEELLPYFAFTSFMNEVDLAAVEARFARMIEVAEAPPPSEEQAPLPV